jgi:hypothetical protein
MLVKYVLSDGISQAFLPFWLVDVIVSTDHDLLSQNGNNTVLLMLFVIMTGFFPPDNLIYLSGLI